MGVGGQSFRLNGLGDGKQGAVIAALGTIVVVAMMAGCSGSTSLSSRSPLIPAAKQGIVHGGQQPVSGATVQLYAVGTTGDGSTATALLNPAVTTDANGGFTITGLYTCPSASALVYLVATGGNPGLGGTVNNSQIAMMAALGQCGSLTPSTYIVVNELTTAAAVYSLAPFMQSATQVGSGASDAAALASAFTLANEYVNTTTGTSPGVNVPNGAVVPTAQLNLIADILAACVNTSGGVAGDSSACGSLLSLTNTGTAPTNTIAAALNIANNPTLNTTALTNLAQATAPFQPMPSGTPQNLVVSVTYPAGLTLSTASLDFGSSTVGFSPASATVTVTNSGSTAISANSISINGTNAGDFSEVSNCGALLSTGGSCYVEVTATPSAVGSRSASLFVGTIGANPVVVTLAVNGTAAAGGSLQFTPSSVNFASATVGYAPTPVSVVVQNTGSTTIHFSGFSITGTNASEFTQTNTCGVPLPPGGSCTAQLTVTAAGLGSRTATFNVSSDASGSPATLPLSATGVSPAAGPAQFNVSGLSYTIAGTTQDIQLENLGTGPLRIQSITSSDPSFVVTGNNCGTSLPAQSLCTVSIQSNGDDINSSYTNVSYSGILTATDDAAAGPQTASLYSLNTQRIGTPKFAATNVGVPVTATFAVDGGTHNIQASVSGSVTGANASDFTPSQAGCTGAGYPPNWQICNFTMTFTPSALGTRTARLGSLMSLGSPKPGYVPLSGSTPGGTPTSAPFTVSGSTAINATLGNNGKGLGATTLTVQNTGSSAVMLSASQISSANPLPFSSNSNCGALAVGASCTVNVFFQTNAVGTASGTFTLTDSVSGYTQSVPITATSSYAIVSLNPDSLTFGSQLVGTTSSVQSFTVGDLNQQPLGHALTASVTSFPGVNYTITQGASCPASTTQLCTVSVVFNPTRAGNIFGALAVTDTVSGNVAYESLYGTATGIPSMMLSPTSLAFASRSVGTTSLPQTVTLTDNGTDVLSISGISLTGTNPGDYVLTNNCGGSLAVNASCTFTVSFAPTATGTRTASVQIVSNASTSPDSVTLTGTAQ